MPSINYAHICEYARMDQSGTVSIIGIFDTIHVQALPANFPFLHVITNLTGNKGEKFSFLSRIALPDGKVLQSAPPVEIAFHQDEANANQINGYLGITFPSFGLYSVELLINGTVVHTIPFRVVQR
jgi:hypothetical protein